MAVYLVNNQVNNLLWVVHTHNVINLLISIDNDLLHMNTSTKSYALTHNISTLGEYYNYQDKLARDVNNLKFSTNNNQLQTDLIPKLEREMKLRDEFSDRIITAVDKGGIDSAIKIYKELLPRNTQLANIETILNSMELEENRLLQERESMSRKSTLQVQIVLPSMILFSIGIGIIIYSVITLRPKEL